MSNYYYGQGKVWIAPITNDAISGGFVAVGDADLLEINPSQEFLDIRESQSGNRKKVKHLVTSTDYGFNMQLKEVTAANLRRAFYGAQTTSGAGTAVVETVTGYEGAMTPVAFPNLSAVSVKVNGGGTDLVLGTDYTVDLVNGAITILSGHTHTDLNVGTSWQIDVTYDHAANEKVEFSKALLANYAIRFEGINVAEGGRAEIVTIHNVAMNISSTLSLIDSSEGTLTIGGDALPDANGDIVTYVV